MPKHFATRRFDDTEHMISTYSQVFLWKDRQNRSAMVCIPFGIKKNTAVHDLACNATSLTNLQYVSVNTEAPRHHDTTDKQRGNTGRRGKKANNIS